MEEFEQIFGTIESVMFSNEENGYSVLKVRDWNGEIITVVGCIPNAAPGEHIESSGSWVEHPNFGRQFKADYCERCLPQDKQDIFSYLSSGIIKGIGPNIASLIVEKFGENSLDVLLDKPEELATINGISLKKAIAFSSIYREKSQLRRLLEYICPYGIKPIIAIKIDSIYKNEAISRISENPYLICEPNIGGSFSEADSLARHFGVQLNDINRIKAAVFYELRFNLNNGHCFIPKESLISATAQMISADPDLVSEVVIEMCSSAEIVLDEIKDVDACYLPELYEAETDIALRLKQLKNNITIITGGPGTGKTTRIKELISEFEHQGLKYYLIAPTGRASKRMSEVTCREAATIHRLLGAMFTEDGNGVAFKKCESDPLICDAVILDECSMVDLIVFDALLKALPADCRLILVGDVDQLPPVGPGNVFKAMLQSEVFNTITLNEIFRQSQDSRIISNAFLINKGEYPDFSENVGDFYRLKRFDNTSSVNTICELCSKRLPEKMGITNEEIQVLSPTKKGELGTRNLNRCLQKVLNPPDSSKKEKVFGDYIFRDGDRIMQTRNNYDMVWHNEDNSITSYGIYNGDIGYIVSIDLSNECLICNFDGRICTYGFTNLNEIEHAWAITVHKSQGSEYKAVVFALSNSSRMLLSRDILYTAVTRARNLLILVGDDEIAKIMIDNSKKANRYSFLRYRIKNNCYRESN